MKKILITIITEDDKFETSSFMNDFISFKSSESAKEYHIKDLYYEEKICFELTEDERIILKNLQKEFTAINRDIDGDLELKHDTNYGFGYDWFGYYNHLFQFIKERWRIWN